MRFKVHQVALQSEAKISVGISAGADRIKVRWGGYVLHLVENHERIK